MLKIVAALDLSKPVNVDPADALGALDDLGNTTNADLTNLHVNGWPNVFANAALNDRTRKEMPVVEPDAADAFLKHLADNGMQSTVTALDPLCLSAGQNELNAVKVAEICGAMQDGTMDPASAPPIVSSDGRVLDGNHRWAASALIALTDPSQRLDVIQVDARWPELLAMADAWHEAQGQSGKSITASARQPAWHLQPMTSPANPRSRWPRGVRRAGQFARTRNTRQQFPVEPDSNAPRTSRSRQN